MNIILLEKSEMTADNTAVISDTRRLEHLFTVLKVSSGDTLKAGVINGNRGTALVTSISSKEVSLSLDLNQSPPSPLPISLICGMCRPKSLKKVLHYTAAMGVKEIHIIKSWRVDKSYWSSPVLEDENIRRELILALEQSGDTILPKVSFHHYFKPFVEDIFPGISRDRLKFLAHPYEAEECPAGIRENAVLVVGPEGGFIQYEVDMFRSAGCTPVTTGERILRVENAVPALLGRLS